MRWLLLKDLQILRRSPLLVALLVIYPIAIALLIGFALSRGPGKPTVAFVNEIPPAQRSSTSAASSSTRPSTRRELFEIGRRRASVDSRARGAREGRARRRGARRVVILPADITAEARDRRASSRRSRCSTTARTRSSSATSSRSIRRAHGGGERRALASSFQQATAGYLQTAARRRHAQRARARRRTSSACSNAHAIIAGAIARAAAEIAAARVARTGRALRAASRSTTSASRRDVLTTVGQPIEVRQTLVGGRRTPLDTFAVGDRGDRLADVRARAARRRPARARARGARLRAARARARLARRRCSPRRSLLAALCAFARGAR